MNTIWFSTLLLRVRMIINSDSSDYFEVLLICSETIKITLTKKTQVSARDFFFERSVISHSSSENQKPGEFLSNHNAKFDVTAVTQTGCPGKAKSDSATEWCAVWISVRWSHLSTETLKFETMHWIPFPSAAKQIWGLQILSVRSHFFRDNETESL